MDHFRPTSKGVKLPDEVKIKISKSKMGIPPWNKGKKTEPRSENTKIKQAITLSKTLGLPYPRPKPYRQTKIYSDWRLNVYKRDQYKCRMPNCDKSDKKIEAHHIKSFSYKCTLKPPL